MKTVDIYWGECVEPDNTQFEKGQKVVLVENGLTHYYVYKDLGRGHCGCYQANRFVITGVLTAVEVQKHLDNKNVEYERFKRELQEANEKHKVTDPCEPFKPKIMEEINKLVPEEVPEEKRPKKPVVFKTPVKKPLQKKLF